MPPFGPIKRKELLRALKQAGFEGPHAGGKHEFLVKGNLRLTLPNRHIGEISRDLLSRILKQAGISREDGRSYESLSIHQIPFGCDVVAVGVGLAPAVAVAVGYAWRHWT